MQCSNLDFRVTIPALLYGAASAGLMLLSAQPAGWIADSAPSHLFIPTLVLALVTLTAVIAMLVKAPVRYSETPTVLISTGAIGTSLFINLLPQLSLTFALIGAYGILGLNSKWRHRWSASFFAVLLIALILPFGISSQTDFGFFMRVSVTQAAAQILNQFGMTLLTAHDVLIFENSLARVDAPCSGLKSLFTGSAFFLAASVVLKRRITSKWLLAYGAFLTLIIAGNVTRIVALVSIIEVFDAQPIAELVHIPLGVLFFTLACTAGTWFLTNVEKQSSNRNRFTTANFGAVWGGLLSVFAVTIGLLIAPQHTDAKSLLFISVPTIGKYEKLALTQAETTFYSSTPQTNAQKWRFTTDDLSGSLLIVRSSALTAMHAPEICFQANGLNVIGMKTNMELSDFSFRELSLNGPPKLQAVYWMQSSKTMTDSFTTRLKRYALAGENDWAMVTVLFDNHPNSSSKMTIDYVTNLKHHIDEMLATERDASHE